MNHKDYIGKELKDLIKDTPNYAINFYFVSVEGKIKHLSDIIQNEKLLSKIITDISDLHSDYSYYIKIRQ